MGFRAHAPARDLDGLLRIRLRAAGQTLADTTLQGLRGALASTLSLRSGATLGVRVEAWIPDGTNGYEGRAVEIELAPIPRVLG